MKRSEEVHTGREDQLESIKRPRQSCQMASRLGRGMST